MGTPDMRVSSEGTFDWHLGYTNKVIPAILILNWSASVPKLLQVLQDKAETVFISVGFRSTDTESLINLVYWCTYYFHQFTSNPVQGGASWHALSKTQMI